MSRLGWRVVFNADQNHGGAAKDVETTPESLRLVVKDREHKWS
ncbi:MAG: hypothetical protein WCC87_05550 [Candidatus Korobacteraceae bacterium]